MPEEPDKIDCRLQAKIFSAIFGNGGPGLLTRVTVNEKAIQSLYEIEKARSRREWAVIIGVGMLLLNAGWERLF